MSISGAITIAFVALSVGWAFAGWNIQRKMFDRLKNELSTITDALKGLGLEHVNTPQHLEAVQAIFGQHSDSMRRSWKEFRESLSSREFQGKVLIRNTEQANAFFSLTKLDGRFNNQNLASIGGSLMTLGILGTFVGLTAGLYGFKMGETEEVRLSITHLIEGMQTSFITSVVGIILGLIYNNVFRRNRAETTNCFERFISEMDHLFQRQTAEEIQDLILIEARAQSKTLSTLGEDFALSLNSAFEKQLVPALTEMNATLNAVGETALKEQSAAVDTMVGAFLEKMTGSLEANFKDLATHLERSVERAEKFGSSLERSQSSLLAMVEKQEMLYANIQGLITGTMDVLEGSHGYLDKMTEVNQNLSSVAGSFSESALEVSGQLEKLAALSVDFVESSKRFQQSSEAMNEIWDSHRSTVTESLTKLDDGIKSYTHQTTENLSSSLDRFEESLSEGVKMFGQASTSLAGNLSDLEEFFEVIHKRVSDWESHPQGRGQAGKT